MEGLRISLGGTERKRSVNSARIGLIAAEVDRFDVRTWWGLNAGTF